jgi:acyl-CoA thioesterase FadM
MSFSHNPTGWICFEGRTEPSWLDTNGHVNFKRYFGLVARATDVLMDEILGGASVAGAPSLHFTLEARIRYAAELKADESLRVLVRPLDRTDKTLRALVTILRTDPNPALSAECEWTGAYIDPATRRIAPLPEAARIAFDAALARISDPPFEPPAFPTGFELPAIAPEHRLQTSSGVITKDSIDRMGHVGLEPYMYIFLLSNMSFMNALGMDRKVMQEEQWGKFVLSSTIRYHAELLEGDRYRIFTRMLWVRRKTACYRHELYRTAKTPAAGPSADAPHAPAPGGAASSPPGAGPSVGAPYATPDGAAHHGPTAGHSLASKDFATRAAPNSSEEILAGTCTNTMAIADLRQRKILPLPDFMIHGLERIHGIRIPADALA